MDLQMKQNLDLIEIGTKITENAEHIAQKIMTSIKDSETYASLHS